MHFPTSCDHAFDPSESSIDIVKTSQPSIRRLFMDTCSSSVSTARPKTCCMDYGCSAVFVAYPLFLCLRSSHPSPRGHLSHHPHPHLFTLCFLASLHLFYRRHRRSAFTAFFPALPHHLFCLLSFPISNFCLHLLLSFSPSLSSLSVFVSGSILSVLLVTVGSSRCGHVDRSSCIVVIICIGLYEWMCAR
jgi:hypothetical protein